MHARTDAPYLVITKKFVKLLFSVYFKNDFCISKKKMIVIPMTNFDSFLGAHIFCTGSPHSLTLTF